MKTIDTIKRKDNKNLRKCFVSVRAYNDFSSRIRSVLEADAEACGQAMQLLDASVGYDAGTIEMENCSMKAQIAFSMIKPEIDKAIERSRAARERAARRKSSAAVEPIKADSVMEAPEKVTAVCGMVEEPSAEEVAEPESESETAIPLSRRARRKSKWREFRLRQKAAKRAIREQREKQQSK